MLIEGAPAKVNLYLHVVGRRADGYHLLDSLAVFPGAADMVHAAPADTLTLDVVGPHGSGLGAGPDNLVLRAASMLAAEAGITAGARLLLDKRLPVASGIGGGSADAAATLRALIRLWAVRLSPGRLKHIAQALGADVPVCLESRASRMQGIGEILISAPVLPSYGMVLLNPGIAIATPEVFRERQAAFSNIPLLPAAWLDAAAMTADLARLRNDLEPPAIALCPAIAPVLDWLRNQPGCLLARMSGSGATCFGLFASGDAAVAVAAQAPVHWWAWGGRVAGGARGFTEGHRTPY